MIGDDLEGSLLTADVEPSPVDVASVERRAADRPGPELRPVEVRARNREALGQLGVK